MPEPINPNADNTNPPADPSVQDPQPPTVDPTPPGDAAPPTSDDALSIPRSALEARLAQAKASGQKELLTTLGLKDADELKATLDAAKQAEEARAEAERAEMSEIQRLQADIDALKEKNSQEAVARAEAEQAAEELRVKNHLHSLFTAKGITNTAYAMFRVEQALGALEDGAELDEAAFVDELVADESQKAALGLAPDKRNANTTPPKDGPDPKPKSDDGDFDAMTATPDEMAKRYRDIGFHG